MSAILEKNIVKPDSLEKQSDVSFLAPIASEMKAVEDLLQTEIQSDVRSAYEVSGHTLAAGGKRLLGL